MQTMLPAAESWPVAAVLVSPPPTLRGTGPAVLSTDYRDAQVSTSFDGRQPFTIDPAIVERGLRGHADTQNELAEAAQLGAIPEPTD